MLHLAQVHKNPHSGKMELQLLACQQAEDEWVVSNSETLSVEEGTVQEIREGMLVLANIDENPQVKSIKDASDWVLGLVRQYCSLKQEEEQWRQDLTLQSQDLTRRNLEIETRTEQIQALEEKLKQEKEVLETRWEQIQQLEAKLKQQKNVGT